ncbi:Thymidylate synthase ThyX [Sulfurovum sp. enrichment culture clone C5]|uniref:Flavin-dependent thymidylate synthase n=1 Tax=Sulfurovum sp. enrichment culture clone C5 TaxID=497650 RepID=A0A0S4XM36_9BACT|nr:Thymidylate synthase ThyX [Sulfurovum sp. enrichment culture clone C5]
MQVTLLHHTPLTVCSNAIRTCWQSFDKSDNGGEKDRDLIDRVGNKFKHASTLEHLAYNFYIKGISRACLQELARHRMTSLSVKSTRYTLKELKESGDIDYTKFLVFTGNETVDDASKVALDNLQKILQSGVSNDIAKYCLPESYKTELTWSINARSLQNFLHLRSSKDALWEIRNLANTVLDALPQDHKYLFEDCMQ